MWKLTGISLTVHDLEFSEYFYGQVLGLGKFKDRDSTNCTFSSHHSVLRLIKSPNKLIKKEDDILTSALDKYVMIEISDFGKAETSLKKAGASFQKVTGIPDMPPTLCISLPCRNILMVSEADKQIFKEDIEHVVSENWKLHHVNLQATDVRETVKFLDCTLGLKEGSWRHPDEKGDFSIKPADLSIFPLGTFNEGLHIIRPDPGFAFRNNFAHNPSIGGHPAIVVEDIGAVKNRLKKEGVLITDAGTYAMANMHQIYCLDPSGNVVEINQYIP